MVLISPVMMSRPKRTTVPKCVGITVSESSIPSLNVRWIGAVGQTSGGTPWHNRSSERQPALPVSGRRSAAARRTRRHQARLQPGRSPIPCGANPKQTAQPRPAPCSRDAAHSGSVASPAPFWSRPRNRARCKPRTAPAQQSLLPVRASATLRLSDSGVYVWAVAPRAGRVD